LTFTAIYPAIELTVFGLVQYIKRVMDQKTLCAKRIPYRTKKQNISSYYDLYAGAIYQIHYKYSSIQNICFVVFLYGAGMPILFPIGLLGLVVLYVVERWEMAVYY
jgi:hypothetical protein